MSTFATHTLETAPTEALPALRKLEQGLGFVPNLAAAMAESATLITGFLDLRGTLATSDELTGVEREIVALAVSLENTCDYCMAAHSTFALMQNADQHAVDAARAGNTPEDPRLGALYQFARSLIANNGHVTEDETQTLLNHGYPRAAVLALVAQAGFTTLANYAHSITKVPVDTAFAPQAWTPATV